ncbi:fungal-specific transcription factor domain protein [Hypoxylon sp. FL0890]|nr:fungal-specific transcription factor domain protein [Hypoxylon sp. FL0890]
MRMYSHGANYVSSVHWAAVLDSISELKDHYEKEKEEEASMLASAAYISRDGPGPRLLYEPVQATRADILASIPPRSVVDRLVSRYFNAHGVASVVLHSGKFLREYESFWQDPDVTPLAWIGLLFSIMCLATQCQQMTEEPANPDTLVRAHVFRERTVHCLILGEFTRGGAHVLETMINYCASEVFMCKDADTGVWLLLGMLVQLALSLGYHRDPQNFLNISPFTGEMRRRMWAAIMQIDLRIASQMGLPRLLKSQQCDTLEPRNLFDSDFDEATLDLPPSRPETEVTPILYNLAKNRIDGIGGLISDLIADTREHPYREIMELDRKLQEVDALLPPIFRWQPLNQSLMVPPQIVLYRIWLKLAVQRLTIWLHRKYLAPSHAQVRYKYSRNACVQAAMKILEFQQLIDEETQPGGQLHPVRWMLTPLIQSTYLLGMSVLCYYVQLARRTPDVPLDTDTDAKIHTLLRNSYPLWLRSSTISREAREAVEHLSLMLGLGSKQGVSPADEGLVHPITPQDSAISLDQVTWDAYQGNNNTRESLFMLDLLGVYVGT